MGPVGLSVVQSFSEWLVVLISELKVSLCGSTRRTADEGVQANGREANEFLQLHGREEGRRCEAHIFNDARFDSLVSWQTSCQHSSRFEPSCSEERNESRHPELENVQHWMKMHLGKKIQLIIPMRSIDWQLRMRILPALVKALSRRRAVSCGPLTRHEREAKRLQDKMMSKSSIDIK